MKAIFMYRKQTDYCLDLLKLSISQWKKNFKNIDEVIICGDYSKAGEEELKKLGSVLNINIPLKYADTKTTRVNYQMVKAFDELKEPFLLCANDVFPIQPINEAYVNKEYKIRTENYEDFSRPAYWWIENYIKMLKHFKKRLGLECKTVYAGHSFYKVDAQFIDFFRHDSFLMENCDRDMALIHFLKSKGENVFIPDFIGTTFDYGEWVWDDTKAYKGINVTMPANTKTQRILNEIKKQN